MDDAPYPLSLAVAVLDQNIGKPGPWNFDDLGAAAVGDAWRVVRSSLDALRAPVGLPSEEEVISMVEEAMWSPASGPVNWTAEKIAAMKAQAARLARTILARLGGRESEGAITVDRRHYEWLVADHQALIAEAKALSPTGRGEGG